MAKTCNICGKSFGWLGGSTFSQELLSSSPQKELVVKRMALADPNAYGCNFCILCINSMGEYIKNIGDPNEFMTVKNDLIDVPKFLATVEKSKNTTIKVVILNSIEEMKTNWTYFNGVFDIISNVMQSISDEIKKLPEERVEIIGSYSSFSIDSNNLYIMDYGKKYIDFLSGFKMVKENLSSEVKHYMVTTLKQELENGLKNNSFLVKKIPIKNIIYYKLNGDVKYTTSVSGGGGGSSVNVVGAVIGDMLFGSTGGFIGSQMGAGVKVDEIKSTTEAHDDRYVTLRYKNEKDKIIEANYPYALLEILNKWIPEKEYDFVKLNGGKNAEQQSEAKTSSADELRQFKALLDEGIITEEEVNAKKKQILGI